MPVADSDVVHVLSCFGQPPTVDQLIAEMQEYEIPAASAKAAIDDAFGRGLLRWGKGATVRAVGPVGSAGGKH